jgi:hypothetical protein
MIRVLAAVWRLPVVDLRVRQTDADAWWFGHWFGRRRRLAWAVLDLPAAEDHYLVGRPKQALRTNLRHARALGVTSSRVTYETWFEAVNAVMRARGDKPGPEQERPPPGQQVAYYVARDARGTALAFAGVALFGHFAVLFSLVSRLDRHPSSLGGYPSYLPGPDLGRSGVSVRSSALPSGKRSAIVPSTCWGQPATCASRWIELARPEPQRLPIRQVGANLGSAKETPDPAEVASPGARLREGAAR